MISISQCHIDLDLLGCCDLSSISIYDLLNMGIFVEQRSFNTLCYRSDSLQEPLACWQSLAYLLSSRLFRAL